MFNIKQLKINEFIKYIWNVPRMLPLRYLHHAPETFQFFLKERAAVSKKILRKKEYL